MNLEQALSLLDGDDEYAGALTTREEYRAAAFVLADEVRKLRAAQQQTKPPHEREPPHCPTCDCGAANQTGERDA